MGNKSAKQTTSLIDQERERQLARTRNIYEPERKQEREFATGLRDEMLSGYRRLAGGDFAGGVGGGVSLDPIYGELEPRYRELSYGLEKSMPGYEEFSRTGGITDEMRDRIRGGGVYDEFAKTGGISDVDRSNIRARGVSPVSSFYSNLRDDLSRRRAVQGGYAPGLSSATTRLAREGAQAAGRTALDTELELSNAIRSGRLAGAAGMAGGEQAYANLLQSGRLAGLGGLERLGQFGFGGLQDVAGARQSVAAQNAASAASNAAYQDRMRLAGLSGLMDIYQSSPRELSRYDAMLGQDADIIARNLDQRYRNVGPQVSPWERVGKIAAGVGGAMSPFFGGA